MVILDEADDFLSQISSDAHWWLISSYTSWARDFRKLNLSVVVSCHGWGLLHDLIYKRANVKLMMRGTKKSENTMIKYTRIFARLDRGMMISEKSNVEFGIAIFRKVPGTIMCRIDGLAGASRFFSDYVAKKIRASYKSSATSGGFIPDFSRIGEFSDLMAEAVTDENNFAQSQSES